MKTITVYTPTYNRAHLLSRCYEALKRQTCKDFIWLIIDDGSTDNTGSLVKKWIKEHEVDIEYIWQENAGMHGAHNTAHMNSKTELSVCCDSDDYLADDAVETIANLWQEKGGKNFVGIVGHDANTKGEKTIEIPKSLKHTKLYDLRYKYKLRGDFKLVYRTALLKETLYPIIESENYLAVGYKYFQIEKKGNLLVTDKILCYVDYQDDGGTANKIKKYVEAPRGFMHYRLQMLPIMHNFPNKYWQSIHYVSSALFAKDWKFLSKSPCKLNTLFAIIPGIALNRYIKLKYYKTKNR